MSAGYEQVSLREALTKMLDYFVLRKPKGVDQPYRDRLKDWTKALTHILEGSGRELPKSDIERSRFWGCTNHYRDCYDAVKFALKRERTHGVLEPFITVLVEDHRAALVDAGILRRPVAFSEWVVVASGPEGPGP